MPSALPTQSRKVAQLRPWILDLLMVEGSLLTAKCVGVPKSTCFSANGKLYSSPLHWLDALTCPSAEARTWPPFLLRCIGSWQSQNAVRTPRITNPIDWRPHWCFYPYEDNQVDICATYVYVCKSETIRCPPLTAINSLMSMSWKSWPESTLIHFFHLDVFIVGKHGSRTDPHRKFPPQLDCRKRQNVRRFRHHFVLRPKRTRNVSLTRCTWFYYDAVPLPNCISPTNHLS